jgi:DNA-binding NarL/FixJ family response regulator
VQPPPARACSPRRVAGKLLERIRQLHIPITTSGGGAAIAIRAALTERELEIFTRLASGNSDKQIAQQLSLSTNTVSNHVKNILAKLQLENRIQAAAQAIRAGIS